MYAIIKISGRQYCVTPDETLKVGKLNAEPGDDVVVTDVIMIADGDNTEIGTPLVDYKVRLEVIEHGRDRKLMTHRFVRLGGVRKKRGHRQHYSMVKVKSIEQGA